MARAKSRIACGPLVMLYRLHILDQPCGPPTEPLQPTTKNWYLFGKVKEGETTNDLYGFLTTAPNSEVKAIHPKAMPVILRNRRIPSDEGRRGRSAGRGRPCGERHWRPAYAESLR